MKANKNQWISKKEKKFKKKIVDFISFYCNKHSDVSILLGHSPVLVVGDSPFPACGDAIGHFQLNVNIPEKPCAMRHQSENAAVNCISHYLLRFWVCFKIHIARRSPISTSLPPFISYESITRSLLGNAECAVPREESSRRWRRTWGRSKRGLGCGAQDDHSQLYHSLSKMSIYTLSLSPVCGNGSVSFEWNILRKALG